MTKTAEKVPLIEEAAGDIIQTFESVSQEANERLKATPVHGADVLASVNTLTSGHGLNAIDNLIQEERDSLQVLSREPAIARVRVRDQRGDESTLFICGRLLSATVRPMLATGRRLAALPRCPQAGN